MATYIKGEEVTTTISGDLVAADVSYELYENNGSAYRYIAENETIDFELTELGLGGGPHTLVVKAKADGYENSDYSNAVEYVEDIALPLINISMADGTNIGSGGSKYNATTHGDGIFADGKFKTANGSGYATIPIDFISNKTSKFTAFFVFDGWTKGNDKYGRFFRFNSDVPNTYLNDPSVTGGSYSIRFKLLNNFTTAVADYVNSSILLKETGSEYYYIPVEANEKLAIAVRCDGTKYSYWKDGVLVATTLCTNATPSPCTWEYLSVGNDTSQYALSEMECSKIMLWNDALTDNEMITLVG